jgi:hypothetical protein
LNWDVIGFKEPRFRLKGLYAVDDFNKLPCLESECDIGARQIFPLLYHPNWRSPTVKHKCPRTTASACLRTVSNKVQHDPVVFEDYASWCRKYFFPEVLACLDHEEIVVDFDEWLDSPRYELAYRRNIRRRFNSDYIKDKNSYRYKCFVKRELQFTKCLHEFKNTSFNDEKERQICAPDEIKKAFANAFINKMEEVCDKYLDGYCGRKNWEGMCKSIEDRRRFIRNIIDGAADQSQFDTSCTHPFNGLMNELMEKCARHRNVIWHEPLSVERLMETLEQSLFCKVSAGAGGINYIADQRCSGDGWTTLMNCWLNLSYWKYTYYLANIKNYYLCVKSDDSLFGHSNFDHPRFLKAMKCVFTQSKESQVHGLGQICKKVNFGAIEDLDFLSNHFFWTDYGHLRMTRIPARIIQTISWSDKLTFKDSQKYENRQALCYSKGMSLLAWATGLPIWETLGHKMVELGKPGLLKDSDYYRDRPRVWQHRDDSKAYCRYLYKFGLDEKGVAGIEAGIKTLTNLSGLKNIPLLELFYRIC